MLGIYKSPTDIENYINNVFKLFKEGIVNTFLLQIKDEQLKGESCRQYRNFDVYLGLYLVNLVYREVKRLPEKEWSYFISKYNLVELRKCFACNGVDLDLILSNFGLPPSTLTSGIESAEIQETLEVEPSDLIEVIQITTPISIIDLLLDVGCKSKIETIC